MVETEETCETTEDALAELRTAEPPAGARARQAKPPAVVGRHLHGVPVREKTRNKQAWHLEKGRFLVFIEFTPLFLEMYYYAPRITTNWKLLYYPVSTSDTHVHVRSQNKFNLIDFQRKQLFVGPVPAGPRPGVLVYWIPRTKMNCRFLHTCAYVCLLHTRMTPIPFGCQQEYRNKH